MPEVDLFEEAGIGLDDSDDGLDLFAAAGIGAEPKRESEPGLLSDTAKWVAGMGALSASQAPLGVEGALRGLARDVMSLPDINAPIDPDAPLGSLPTRDRSPERAAEVERAVSRIKIPGSQAAADWGERVREDLIGSTSAKSQAAVEGSQISGKLWDPSTWDFGDDPSVRGYYLQATGVLGSMAPTLLSALVTKRVGRMRGATEAGATDAATKAGGLTGGAMAAGEGAQDAAEFVDGLTDEEMQAVPLYQQLLEAGSTDTEAREAVKRQAVDIASANQGVVGAVGDALLGRFITGGFDKALGKVASGPIAGRAVGGAATGLESGTTEALENVAADLGVKSVVPSKEVGEDTLGEFTMGLLGGGGPGVMRGTGRKQGAAESEAQPGEPFRVTITGTSEGVQQQAKDEQRTTELDVIEEQAGLTEAQAEERAEIQARQEAQPNAQTLDYDSYVNYRRTLESNHQADAKADTSSAYGIDQFTKKTWLGLVQNHQPAWAEGLSEAEILAKRSDPDISGQMAELLDGENARALSAAGQPINSVNLYASHHFGADRGVQFARASGDTRMSDILSPEQIEANKYLKGLTKDQAIANWNRRAGVPHEVASAEQALRDAEADLSRGLEEGQQQAEPQTEERTEQRAEQQEEQQVEKKAEQNEEVERQAAEEARDDTEFDPTTVRANRWPDFVNEMGHRVSALRRGTPLWGQLREQWRQVETARAADPNASGDGTQGPVIQNRARENAASVLQMNSIAQNPDYMRLGPSRSPETGAPMAFANHDLDVPTNQWGGADTAVMADGQRVSFRYLALDANDVQPSHFVDGSANPMFESEHPGVIRALNNGRTAALRAAYERGTAEQYKRELIADERAHGIAPEVIEAMDRPVLVRLYSSEQNAENMGALSQSTALGLSASEQAQTDAALMDAAALDLYQPDSGMDTIANRPFVQHVMGVLQNNGQDVAGMVKADGTGLSNAGIARMRALMMQMAYGDNELVESLFVDAQSDFVAIGNALQEVAGDWIQMRRMAANGAINADVDVTENLLQAIRLIRKARRERTALVDLVQQTDIETGQAVGEITEGLVRMMYSGTHMTRAVGRARLAESLRHYTQGARATSPQGMDMFGESVGPLEILRAIRERAADGTENRQAQAAQRDGQPDGGDAAGGGAAEPRAQAQRPQPDPAGQDADGDGQAQADAAEQPSDRQSDQEAARERDNEVAEQEALQQELEQEQALQTLPDDAADDAFARAQVDDEAGRQQVEPAEQVVAQPETEPAAQEEEQAAPDVRFEARGEKALYLHGDVEAIRARLAEAGHPRKGRKHGDSLRFDRAQDEGALRAILEPEGEAAPQEVAQQAEEDFELASQTEEEAQAEAARRDQIESEAQRERQEQERKAEADARRDSFALTGSDRDADVAAAAGQQDLLASAEQTPATTLTQQTIENMDDGEPAQAPEPIEDFGEKLGGARKDQVPSLDRDLSSDDISRMRFSEIWPKKEVDNVEDTNLAAALTVLRGFIGTKPRSSYKLKRWVEQVTNMRALAHKLMNDDGNLQKFLESLRAVRTLTPLADKIELLQALDRGNWSRVGEVRVVAGATRWVDGVETPASYASVQIDKRRRIFEDAESVADIVTKVNNLLGESKGGNKRLQFQIRRTRGGVVFINKKGDRDYTRLKTFDSVEAARDFLNDQYAELEKLWEAHKDRVNVTKADMRRGENRPRTGEDWRKGEDVTPEQFSDAFKFRGVEFGNWVKADGERQGMLNQAYDALMDLANIINVPPRALSLNGELGLGFGSRGRGRASAHFESGKLVINLTRTRGAGSLGHEWFHALDNYFARMRPAQEIDGRALDAREAAAQGAFITYRPEPMMVMRDNHSVRMTKGQLEARRKRNPDVKYLAEGNWELDPNHPEGVRPEVEKAFADLVQALNDSPMAERARTLDKGKKNGYWSQIIERGARSFENYLIGKMNEAGYNNDHLANVTTVEEFQRDLDRYPYLKPDELAPVSDAFDKLFETVETRETEDGNVAMFSHKATESAVNKWQESLRQAASNPQARGPNMPTPAVLRMMGSKAKRLVFPRTYLQAVMGKHPDVPARVFENLPAMLADPLFIIPHRGGGLRVFVEAETALGEPIAVGVSVDAGGRIQTITPFNDVGDRGAGVRRRDSQVAKAHQRGEKIYARNKEALEQARASAAAAPGLIPLHRGSVSTAAAPGTIPLHRRSRASVLTRADVVKRIRRGDANYSLTDQEAANAEGQDDSRFESGIPQGLPAQQTDATRRLARGINRELRRFRMRGQFRAEEVTQDQLPDALRGALGAFRDATGVETVIFRNRTPEVLDFNGVNFRDGRVYVNEDSQHPVITTASHEWLHNLRRTHPELYQQLADEVQRQGRMDAYQQKLRKDGEARWQNRDVVEEELTAAAVGDALTDPQFLQDMAQKNEGLFKRVAKAFLEFLDTLTNGWRDQGSNAYLQDVQAFRDTLMDVISAMDKPKKSGLQQAWTRVEAMFSPAAGDRGAQREGLSLATAQDGDARFETGAPVTFQYAHNPQSATDMFGLPQEGDQFQRDLEPSGRYVVAADKKVPGWESGELTFQNPLVLEHNGWKRNLRDVYGRTGRDLSQALIDDGYDGVVTVDGDAASEILDLTTFDYQEARYSRKADGAVYKNEEGRPDRITLQTPWDSPSSTKFDSMVYLFQDKHVDTKRVQAAIKEAGNAIGDDLDIYLKETLYHGRAAKRTKDFVQRELDPLLEQMRADGLTMEALEQYLHARHAKEANELIARRDPSMRDGGSGMGTADAQKYLDGLKKGDRTRLDRAAKLVDKMLAQTRQLYVDYGLESQSVVDGWGKMFDHYVPLHREDMAGGTGLGQGFSVAGREVKGRTGSTRKVVDILANIAMQRERVITRGEKNRVALALYGLAKTQPNPDYWQTDVVPVRRTLGNDGMVHRTPDRHYKMRDNVVVVKMPDRLGRVTERAIVFNERNERAVRMALSLKNLDTPKLEGFMGGVQATTRYLAAINTQYNPIFGVKNLVRDIGEGALNLESTPIAGKQAEVVKHIAPALKSIMQNLRAERRGESGAGGELGELWQEFQNRGGQTGYRDLFRDSSHRAKVIQRTLTPEGWMETKAGTIFTAGGALRAPWSQAQKRAKWAFDMLSDYNEAMENATRLAAFKTGIDSGMTRDQAAALAKGLTVNFNRKGQSTRLMGALYAFFNATVQGSTRMGQTLFTMDAGKPKTLRLSRRGKTILIGGVLYGAMQAVMLSALGYDDDDIPELIRERNFIIPTGGGKYITVPMPLGYHFISNLGRIPMEMMLGETGKAEAVFALMGMLADAFNPTGGDTLSIGSISPTPVRPLVEVAENKNFTGRPIARTSFDSITPGHQLARDTATLPATWASQAINWLTGGTEYTRGEVSPTPDQIDYLIGQATGGVGREISKASQTVQALVTGDDLPTYKIPLVGTFFGNTENDATHRSRFWSNLEDIKRHAAQADGLDKDGRYDEAMRYEDKHPEISMQRQASRLQRKMSEVRRQRKRMQEEGASRKDVRQLDKDLIEEIKEFNEDVEKERARVE